MINEGCWLYCTQRAQTWIQFWHFWMEKCWILFPVDFSFQWIKMNLVQVITVVWRCAGREQDSSPTRQFTDTDFEDSSPTDLKTVHRHFWRQFIDTFFITLLIYGWKINWLLWRNIDELWFEVICWYIICWESDILLVWLMIDRQTFDCYIKLYWCDHIANRTLFWRNSPAAIQSIPFEYLNRFVHAYLFIFI